MATATHQVNAGMFDLDPAAASAWWTAVPGSATVGWTAHKKYFMAIPITARGSFEEITATVSIPDGAPERATARVEVQAESQRSGQAKRDNHLLGPGFFDVETHSEIRFESTSIRAIVSSSGGYEVSGLLHARGASLPITLTGTFDPALDSTQAHVTLSGSFNRRDLGMTWNAVPLMTLGDEIALHVEVDLERAQATDMVKLTKLRLVSAGAS